MENSSGDLELWQAFKKGDELAFSQIYGRYIKVLYKYGQKVSSDTKVVEDAIQDLFVDIWNSRSNLTDPESVKYYLMRILRRKISRNLEYPNKTEQLNEFDPDQILNTESIESEMVRIEGDDLMSRKIQNAILHLSSRQQEAINLRYFHNFSHNQIAEIMDISLQSVHNTLQKAMKGLRDLLPLYPGGLILFFYFFESELKNWLFKASFM